MIMKTVLSVFVIAILFFAGAGCKSKAEQDAIQNAKDVQGIVKENTPGRIPTSETGYYMKAKVNGKDWVAKTMMPNDGSNQRNVYGDNNGERVTFDVWMRGLEEGKKSEFKEGHSAAYFPNHDDGMWVATTGETEITRVADNWLEGKFFFTATQSESGKSIEVTEGFFRIPISKNQ